MVSAEAQIVAGSSKSRHPARKTDNSLRMNIYPPEKFYFTKSCFLYDKL
ncbi:hypothetical protein RUMOBE_00154 [Blautia obeum ATCC 29174]|uniref:Uncharacterized protein n=1 Tax=Blautia obeum ATCC 29174 TaxID=411459 RepID=A5ZMD6_9FIRM|nr:hypothetical protein RUMOBE_00154 [Blautia obeum ATCC 29174]